MRAIGSDALPLPAPFPRHLLKRVCRLPGLVFFGIFLMLTPAFGSVELALNNNRPTTIDEVYYREGVTYLPIDEVLPVLGLKGRWDSVTHLYEIKTPNGKAVISPGSQYLRLGERFLLLKHMPRFIDGRLRVDETLVREQLPALIGLSLYYRNIHPPLTETAPEESSLDRFLNFYLKKKTRSSGSSLRGVVIDPGHGGQDPGSLGIDGSKEKTVALTVARNLEKQLKMQLGIPVYLTRDNDYALSLDQRMEPAMRSDVDVLLQLHAQASFSKETSGIVLVVRAQEEFEGRTIAAEQGASMQLALKLQEALRKQGFAVHEIVAAPLLPLGRGNLPTVLVELGYLTNVADVASLTQTESQDRLVLALFAGLKAFAHEQKEMF